MFKNIAAFAFLIFFAVVNVNAGVEISEIAACESGNGEWLEIWNNGTETVDVASWKMTEGGVNHSLKQDTVLAGGDFAVIVDREDEFRVLHPSFSGAVIDSSFSLLNGGENVALTQNGESVFEWNYPACEKGFSLYSESGSWVSAPPTPGYARVGSVSSGGVAAANATGAVAELNPRIKIVRFQAKGNKSLCKNKIGWRRKSAQVVFEENGCLAEDWVEIACENCGEGGFDVGGMEIWGTTQMRVLENAVISRKPVKITLGSSLHSTDFVLSLRNGVGQMYDAVCWDNRDVKMTDTKKSAIEMLRDDEKWRGECLDSREMSAKMLFGRKSGVDTNVASDFVVSPLRESEFSLLRTGNARPFTLREDFLLAVGENEEMLDKMPTDDGVFEKMGVLKVKMSRGKKKGLYLQISGGVAGGKLEILVPAVDKTENMAGTRDWRGKVVLDADGEAEIAVTERVSPDVDHEIFVGGVLRDHFRVSKFYEPPIFVKSDLRVTEVTKKWVEIGNFGGKVASLAGWRVNGKILPAGVVRAGGFVTIPHEMGSGKKMELKNPGKKVVSRLAWSGKLKNGISVVRKSKDEVLNRVQDDKIARKKIKKVEKGIFLARREGGNEKSGVLTAVATPGGENLFVAVVENEEEILNRVQDDRVVVKKIEKSRNEDEIPDQVRNDKVLDGFEVFRGVVTADEGILGARNVFLVGGGVAKHVFLPRGAVKVKSGDKIEILAKFSRKKWRAKEVLILGSGVLPRGGENGFVVDFGSRVVGKSRNRAKLASGLKMKVVGKMPMVVVGDEMRGWGVRVDGEVRVKRENLWVRANEKERPRFLVDLGVAKMSREGKKVEKGVFGRVLGWVFGMD